MRGEIVTFTRDCRAIQVPDGIEATINEGMEARITQALGGSLTVVTQYGQMFRLDRKDADAIGRDASDFGEGPKLEGSIDDQVWAQLATCYDPEIPINIVELGLVYHCGLRKLDDGTQVAEIKMTLTAPGCGMGDVIKAEVEQKVESIEGVSQADVEIVFEPQWNQSMMSEAARLQTGLM